MTTTNHNTRFADRLGVLVARTRRRVLGHGLVRVLVVGGGALLASAWAVGAGPETEGFLAWGLTLSLGLVLLVSVRHFLVRPLASLRTAHDLVRRLEVRGQFDNLLLAAEEAQRDPARWPEDDPVGRELKRRLFVRADGLLDLVGPDDAHPVRRARTWMAAGAGVAVLFLVYTLGAPGDFARGLARLATPWPDMTVTPTGGIYGIATEGTVVAGGPVALEAWDFAGGPGLAVCEIRTERGVWQPLPSRQGSVAAPGPVTEVAYRRWTAGLSEVREDFVWRFRRGALVSDERKVVVRQHPLVTALSASVEPPAYTRVPSRNLERLPVRFEVPAGSTLSLSGRTNHPVTTARLVIGSGDTLVVAVDSVALAVQFEVPESMTFTLELEDAWGLSNHAPLHYEVTAAADEAPVVELFRPADDGILPLDGDLALDVAAADDFGLAQVSLLVRTLSGREDEARILWRGGPFWPGPADIWKTWPVASGDLAIFTERLDENPTALGARFRLTVRTGDLDLVPGDVLEIVAEAVDNKQPPPAGQSRSQVLRLTLPSAVDVLDQQATASEEHRSDLEEMRRRSGELENDLDRLTRELMKNPLPDWARQQEMEKAIQRQQALQEELSRVAGELERELDNLARGQLTSEAQLEKADQVSELLSQEGSDRLKDLLARLEEGTAQVPPDEVARAMDEVARNQKEMARKLDAALAMLQRMAQEQELEGLTALIEQMMRKQQELAEMSRELAEQQKADGESGETGESEESEGSEESDSTGQETPSTEELARRQEALAQDLEQLQEKLEQAIADMKEQAEQSPDDKLSQDMAEAMEEALEKLKEQKSSDKMDQASEQLEQMDPEKAAEMQEQALRDLGSLYHVMLQTQQAMQMAMSMEQVSSLRGLAADLLAVSTRQEEIVASIPPRLRDLRTLELTRDQHRIQQATIAVRNNLSGLLDESPTRILKLLAKLDGLIEEMGAGLRAMEENRAPNARNHARESLATANNIVIGLLTEAQMSGGGGGGGGSSQPSASEELQEMIRKQAELNGATDELRKMLADRGMSQESRSQMERLGQEQAQLAERMGQLSEGKTGQGGEQGQGETGGQGGEGGESGERPGDQGRGEGPEEVPETMRPETDRILGDLSQLEKDMETVGQDIEGGLVSEETLRRQERILGRMLDARNSVRERDYSNRRESKTAGRLYADQMGADGGADPEGPSLRQRYQPLEKAPLEYRDLVRRYFTALDALRKMDADGTLPKPETREDTP